MSISELNNLIFERLGLVDSYIQERKQLESHISLANVCISKAKTTRGVTLFSVGSIDTHDLEPSIHISVDSKNESFSLVKDNDEKAEVSVKNRKSDKSTTENDKEEEEKAKILPKNQFRPFGVLEPSSAKDARNEMKRSIEIICELASLQQQIRKIDDKIDKLYKQSLEDAEIVEKFKSIVVK